MYSVDTFVNLLLVCALQDVLTQLFAIASHGTAAAFTSHGMAFAIKRATTIITQLDECFSCNRLMTHV